MNKENHAPCKRIKCNYYENIHFDVYYLRNYDWRIFSSNLIA